jgi:hypothetical protein
LEPLNGIEGAVGPFAGSRGVQTGYVGNTLDRAHG